MAGDAGGDRVGEGEDRSVAVRCALVVFGAHAATRMMTAISRAPIGGLYAVQWPLATGLCIPDHDSSAMSENPASPARRGRGGGSGVPAMRTATIKIATAIGSSWPVGLDGRIALAG